MVGVQALKERTADLAEQVKSLQQRPVLRVAAPTALENASWRSPEDTAQAINGNAVLDANGEAWVELPAAFEATGRDFRYQLTAIGAPGPSLYVAEEVHGKTIGNIRRV